MIDVTLGMKQILLNTLEDVFLKDYLDKFSKVMPGATRADIWRLFEKEYDVVFDTLIQGHNVLPFKDGVEPLKEKVTALVAHRVAVSNNLDIPIMPPTIDDLFPAAFVTEATPEQLAIFTSKSEPPAEIPAQAPVETPTNAPTETPAKAPEEKSAQAPVEEAPAQPTPVGQAEPPKVQPKTPKELALDDLKAIGFPEAQAREIVDQFFGESTGTDVDRGKLLAIVNAIGLQQTSVEQVRELLHNLGPAYGFPPIIIDHIIDSELQSEGTGDFFASQSDAVSFIQRVLNLATQHVDVSRGISKNTLKELVYTIFKNGGKTEKDADSWLEQQSLPLFLPADQLNDFVHQAESFVYATKAEAEQVKPSNITIDNQDAWRNTIADIVRESITNLETRLGYRLGLEKHNEYSDKIQSALEETLDTWVTHKTSFSDVNTPIGALKTLAKSVADEIYSEERTKTVLEQVRTSAYKLAKQEWDKMSGSLAERARQRGLDLVSLAGEIEKQQAIFWDAFEKAMGQVSVQRDPRTSITEVVALAKAAVSAWFAEKQATLQSVQPRNTITLEDIQSLPFMETIKLQAGSTWDAKLAQRGTDPKQAEKTVIGLIIQTLMPLVGTPVPEGTTKDKYLLTKLDAAIFKVLAAYEDVIFK